MERQGAHRKLTAVLYADVAGYSRLTGADEEGTHRALGKSLDFIAATIEGRGGQVIHYAGDAVLAAFESVLVAVEVGVEIQRGLGETNRTIDEERRLQYRIGINLGDVIVDRNDIYGDGVNVAARLESLADPGGICVSAKVRDEIGNKLDLSFEDMGEQRVKNIADPVRAYRVGPASAPGSAPGVSVPMGPASVPGSRPRPWAMPVALLVALIAATALVWYKPWAPPIDVASEAKMAFPLPDKPSIAVLPFDNLSDDPAQGYFADGISEDIITTLSKVPRLFVIARNSSFVYKGKPVKVQQVAEDLGVRYVLEGSVQRANGKVRITAQLADALTGNHLWAERYDRDMTGLFALQDEITSQIVVALRIKLTEGEEARVHHKHTRNIDAWNLLNKGLTRYHGATKTDNAGARKFFESAAEVDSGYALAYAMLAWTHWQDAYHGWSENRGQSIERAATLAEKAQALDDTLPDVHALQGSILLAKKQYVAALTVAEKAVALNPNHSTNTAQLGMILLFAGQPEAAIAKLQTAMRLSPYYPAWFLEVLGFAYFGATQPDEALSAFGKFLEREPGAYHAAHAHVGRALAHHALDRENEARADVAKALTANPEITLKQFGQLLINRNQAEVDALSDTLRRLGMPD